MNVDKKKIICLGPKGSYAEIAANKAISLLGLPEIEVDFSFSITKVIEDVDKHDAAIGVIPVENSIEGIVRETVDTLLRASEDIKVFAELTIPVSHCLISKAEDISEIKNVVSYTQALAQCHRFIAENLPSDVKVISAPSTSEAVRSLSGLDNSYAAIGNYKAAEIYGFNILKNDINDEKDNKTRFICIDRVDTDSTGNDKTSLALSTINEPGALVNVLNVLKKRNINMSYIESRPSKKIFGEYTFFIDLDGHFKDKNVKEALEEIQSHIHFYRHLGSYPKYPIG